MSREQHYPNPADPFAPALRADQFIVELNEDVGPPRVLTGDYTLRASDNGAVFRSDSDTALTVTVSGKLPEGFNAGVCQRGAGAVTFSAANGATKVGSGSATTQYSVVTVYVARNVDQASAEFAVLGGA